MNKVQTKKINPLVNEIFPDEDLKHKYKVKKIIGKGQFGYVAKAVQKKTNQFVAIKKIVNVFNNESQTKRILRQIILLKNCNHPNIVSLIQVLIPHNQSLQNFDKIYIVTEYCDTDLRKLFQMEDTFLQINDVKYILYQIACGIKYLHSASIIHRDLTPSNILINGQGMKVKICDLGLARVVEKKQTQNNVQDSSDEENLQDQIKKLTIQQQQALKKQSFNPYEHIDADSSPSTPNTQNKSVDQYFDDSEEYFMKRRRTNQNIKVKQQENLSSSDNLDDLRGSQKSAHQIKQSDKKKRKLKRMDSVRSEKKEQIKGFQKQQQLKGSCSRISNQSQKSKQSPTRIQKKQLKKRLSNNPIAKLTLKVTTRWYRAPQVILLQKGYHKPIDIWSLGCLFGQLLKMMKTVCYNPMQRFPLFPGKHCYPVSPATLCNINRQANKKQQSGNIKNDQLFMILSTIGKPGQQDLEFLTDEGAKDYIRGMQKIQRKQFKKFFPSLPEQAINILQQTLLFNPHKRINIEGIINHPFLQKVKNKQLEKEGTPVIMEFEEQQNLSIQLLKKYLANQIKTYLI